MQFLVVGHATGLGPSELRLVSEMKELRAVLVEITEAVSPGYRRMQGLNDLFQLRAVHDRGGTARSIKLELLAIENCTIRAETVRRECIARLEKKDSGS